MARPSLKRAETRLVTYALGFPGAVEEWPWGERAIKVNGRIFASIGFIDDVLRIGLKLPVSSEMALTLPFVQPARYGLGKSGWIAARFAKGEDIPFDTLEGWIEQSYRAVAPKKLVKALAKEPTS